MVCRCSVLSPRVAVLGVCGWLLCAGTARAIVLYPGDTGVPAGQRPADDVIGSWANNGSAVAIGPDSIVTVRHTAGGVGSLVTFGTNTYVVKSETDIGNADVRVCRITQMDGSAAKLADFVGIYSGTAEVGQGIVLGGFGQGNGGAISDATGQGFAWDGSANTTLRWGTNFITQTAAAVTSGSFVNDVLLDTFDPQLNAGLTHEAAMALYDSGGGWFINQGGQWQLAGLSQGTEHVGASYFVVTAEGRSDINQAVRISSYASAIDAAVPEPTAIAAMIPLAGLLLRRRRSI